MQLTDNKVNLEFTEVGTGDSNWDLPSILNLRECMRLYRKNVWTENWKEQDFALRNEKYTDVGEKCL